MSSQGNGEQVPYDVKMSEKTHALLKKQHLEAAKAGKGAAFVAALRQIFERLRADPRSFGDPLYHLPALKLLICHANVGGLVVYFGIHEELPLVFIRGFNALS